MNGVSRYEKDIPEVDPGVWCMFDHERLTTVCLNNHEFIPHEIGSPLGWIKPEIAQHSQSTYMTSLLARGGPVPIRPHSVTMSV